MLRLKFTLLSKSPFRFEDLFALLSSSLIANILSQLSTRKTSDIILGSFMIAKCFEFHKSITSIWLLSMSLIWSVQTRKTTDINTYLSICFPYKVRKKDGGVLMQFLWNTFFLICKTSSLDVAILMPVLNDTSVAIMEKVQGNWEKLTHWGL